MHQLTIYMYIYEHMNISMFFLEWINREETREDKEDDEIIDDKEEEELAATEKIDYIPPVVRAVVKFGYDKGLIEVLEKYNTTFEDWFNGVLTHTQAHFREGRLGTIIELEVEYKIKGLCLSVLLKWCFRLIFDLLNYRLHTLISIGMTYAGIAVIIMGMQQMSSLNMI